MVAHHLVELQLPEIIVTNSIFWDNATDVQIPDVPWSDYFIGSINVSNSLIDTTSEWNYYNIGSNNIYLNPLFCDEGSGNFTLAANSPLVGTGEDENNIGALGIGCEAAFNGPVWHVATTGSDITGDGSEENPFASIQFGIDYISEYDSLYVHEGIYVENINFNGRKISVIGENKQTTIIDGNRYW